LLTFELTENRHIGYDMFQIRPLVFLPITMYPPMIKVSSTVSKSNLTDRINYK